VREGISQLATIFGSKLRNVGAFANVKIAERS
jgi:hypothetical protein